MEYINKEVLRTEYMARFLTMSQELIEKRKNLRINQNTIACKIGVSLKTVQNFESFKCFDYYLIFAYKKLLSFSPEEPNQ